MSVAPATVLKDGQAMALTGRTVPRLIEDAARDFADIVALKDVQADGSARVWTYREMLSAMRRTAAWLGERFEPGEHVAIWAPNSTEWAMFQLGAAAAGLVLVTMNPALSAAEADYMLRRSKAVGLIAASEFRGVELFAVGSDLVADISAVRTIVAIEEWSSLVESCEDAGSTSDVQPDQAALMIFTSGTTGKPKAVILRQAGIVDNAVLGARRYELDPGAVWLGALPLFHIGGAVTSLLGCIGSGGTYLVLPAFEAGWVLKLIEQERVAWLPTVPTTVLAMAGHVTFPDTDLSSLRVLLTGGTVITPELVALAKREFKADVQVMFGQTEAGGGLTKTFRSDPVEKISASVGFPYPCTQIRIVDVATGRQVGAGEVGEIRVESPFVMSGYFDDPEGTRAAFDSDGFLKTGDLGTLDRDGYLSVRGRLKEMLIRGGENIYCREVEDALSGFPAIAEAAVIGVPSAKWGEEVGAAILCHPGQAADIEAIRGFLEQRLARHKIPSHWRIVSEFKRTALGKIQKFELNQMFGD